MIIICPHCATKINARDLKLETTQESDSLGLINEIVSYWNSKNILGKIRKPHTALQLSIIKSVERYNKEDVKRSIDNYNEIMMHPETYWYSYRCNMLGFFQIRKTKNSIYEVFLDENKPLENFSRSNTRSFSRKQSRGCLNLLGEICVDSKPINNGGDH